MALTPHRVGTKNRPHYYFNNFKQWRHVWELLLTSNILAITLAVASVSNLSELSWITVFHYTLFVTWITICFVVSVDYIQRVVRHLSRSSLYVICFFVLLFLVIANTCLVNLLHYLVRTETGSLSLTILFNQSLHHMLLGGGLGLICLRYLYVREQWIEQQQSELMARVQALQARIHPHFLFNSLNSVVSLIAIDPFKAEQMLIDLSSLFRASLTELKEVSLQEEIELCQRYLKIESVRLGDRLNVKWRVDGEQNVQKVKIPLLTLQPLLENCIYHGVESLSIHSTVSILIEIRGTHVSIVLTNPYKSGSQSSQGNGIAIDNVKQRLMAYYGSSVKFVTYAQNGIYTTLLSYKYQ